MQQAAVARVLGRERYRATEDARSKHRTADRRCGTVWETKGSALIVRQSGRLASDRLLRQFPPAHIRSPLADWAITLALTWCLTLTLPQALHPNVLHRVAHLHHHSTLVPTKTLPTILSSQDTLDQLTPPRHSFHHLSLLPPTTCHWTSLPRNHHLPRKPALHKPDDHSRQAPPCPSQPPPPRPRLLPWVHRQL